MAEWFKYFVAFTLLLFLIGLILKILLVFYNGNSIIYNIAVLFSYFVTFILLLFLIGLLGLILRILLIKILLLLYLKIDLFLNISNTTKLFDTKLKYWLDDYFNGGNKDNYRENSFALTEWFKYFVAFILLLFLIGLILKILLIFYNVNSIIYNIAVLLSYFEAFILLLFLMGLLGLILKKIIIFYKKFSNRQNGKFFLYKKGKKT